MPPWVPFLPVLRRRRTMFGAVGLCLALYMTAGLFTAHSTTAETAPAPEAEEVDPNAGCIECHGDETLVMEKNGRTLSLLVTPEQVARSAHDIFDCVDCHEGLDPDAKPHANPMPRVDCVSCHEDAGKKHPFHSRIALTPMPVGGDTDCVGCHGTHETTAVKHASFPYKRGQQAESCGKCHEKERDHFVRSAHGLVLAKNSTEAPSCLECHNKPGLVALDGVLTVEHKLAQTGLCESCHVENEAVVGHSLRGTRFVASFEKSVHGSALREGDVKSASCVDCHGAHEMNRAVVAGARTHFAQQTATCGACHEQPATEFTDSVHATLLQKGSRDAPVCTDCHGEHDILAHTNLDSPVHERNVAQQVCATCHNSLRLTRKYGLSTQAFETFSDSYHGLSVRGGAVEVVNCASCHSAHGIKSHLDPTSTVHKANLVQTCGQCHPGANTRFTVGAVHVSPTSTGGAAGASASLYWIAAIYVVLITVVVGGMVVHNGLDFAKKVRRKLAVQKGLIEEEPVAHRLYLRMTAHERLQHAALVISFVLLVITGFMLRYPEAWWVTGIRRLSLQAFEWRSLVHRVAGVALLVAGVWHVAYLAFTRPGRALLRDLLPRWRDVTDPWKVLRYNVGLSPTKPAFGRFSYIEKTEYWALVWGTLLMGVTGVILWFDNTSMGLFTKLGFDIARSIHFYEAILATLAIIVWHFYFVIFNPDVYPMNLAWLTGRMSEREMLEEHPAELARLKALEGHREAHVVEPPPPVPPQSTKDAPPSAQS